MDSTFVSGEKLRLEPEGEEVKFVGVLQGAPLVSSQSRGTFQATWDRLKKLSEVTTVVQNYPPAVFADEDTKALIRPVLHGVGTEEEIDETLNTPVPEEDIKEVEILVQDLPEEVQKLADTLQEDTTPIPETFTTTGASVEEELQRRLDVHERNSPCPPSDPEPEAHPPVPHRITKKWLKGLSVEELKLLVEKSDLAATRMARVEDELYVRENP